jgi:hypothetical protein
MAEDSVLPDEKKIYDLTEIYEERNGRNNSEVIIVDGRGYERVSKDNKHINDLVDFAGEQSAADKINEEILKRVTEITERIAREILPDVAERVIREEIDKLKKLSGIGSNAVK